MNGGCSSSKQQTKVYLKLCWIICLGYKVAGFAKVRTNVGFHRFDKEWRLYQEGNNACHDMIQVSRRLLFSAMAAATSTMAFPPKPGSSAEVISPTSFTSPSLTVPLEFTGQELLIYYRVDGSLFRAVVDTGSPFLLIPGSCGTNTRSKAGCYREQGVPSGLPDTFEQFDGFEGNVEWRMAPVTLENATGGLMTNRPMITFGVAGESILGGPGGVFFGLIRDTEAWIRPSFLSQTMVSSFQLDLRTSQKTLTLSQYPLIGSEQDAIRLTSDLRRRYGDPVTHYTCQAESISVNGVPLVSTAGRKPIYVIFDTGVTGMVVSRDLFNERYVTARQRREKSLWGQVDIAFQTLSGNSVVLSASKPLTTPFDPQKNWTKFRGHLIVVGLAFLDGKKMTVDIDRKNVVLEN